MVISELYFTVSIDVQKNKEESIYPMGMEI